MSAYVTPAQKAEAIALAAQHLLDLTGDCEIDDGWCSAHAEDVEALTCEIGEARSTLRKALAAEVVPDLMAALEESVKAAKARRAS